MSRPWQKQKHIYGRESGPNRMNQSSERILMSNFIYIIDCCSGHIFSSIIMWRSFSIRNNRHTNSHHIIINLNRANTIAVLETIRAEGSLISFVAVRLLTGKRDHINAAVYYMKPHRYQSVICIANLLFNENEPPHNILSGLSSDALPITSCVYSLQRFIRHSPRK